MHCLANQFFLNYSKSPLSLQGIIYGGPETTLKRACFYCTSHRMWCVMLELNNFFNKAMKCRFIDNFGASTLFCAVSNFHCWFSSLDFSGGRVGDFHLRKIGRKKTSLALRLKNKNFCASIWKKLKKSKDGEILLGPNHQWSDGEGWGVHSSLLGNMCR